MIPAARVRPLCLLVAGDDPAGAPPPETPGTGRRPAPPARTRDVTAPGTDHDVPVRLYLPPGRAPEAGRPLVVVLPGGCWLSGGLGAAAELCRHVAAEVGHRLAPRHPAPAAVQDVYAAITWLAEHADAVGARPDRLAVLGIGAGGGLAAAVTLDARDRGRPALAFQVLIRPATDLSSASATHRRSADAGLRSCADEYLGELADPRDPLVSPLLAEDHLGLPAALVVTAAADPLRDDGLAYVRALRGGGVPTEHVELPGVPRRPFTTDRPCRSGAEPALDVAVAALRRALG